MRPVLILLSFWLSFCLSFSFSFSVLVHTLNSLDMKNTMRINDIIMRNSLFTKTNPKQKTSTRHRRILIWIELDANHSNEFEITIVNDCCIYYFKLLLLFQVQQTALCKAKSEKIPKKLIKIEYLFIFRWM